MNDVEKSDLARCERVIKKTRVSFIECGNALAEIRDKRLYRSTHKNFNDYCQEKWGFGRSHAYRMIDAAAHAELSPMGDSFKTERAARADIAASKTKPPVVLDEHATEEDRTNAAAVFAQAPPPADVGEATPQGESETPAVATPEMGPGRSTDGDSDENESLRAEESADFLSSEAEFGVGNGAQGEPATPPSSFGHETPDPISVEPVRGSSPSTRPRTGSGPAHKIPMREAGATLYRAITTLETLVADKHNGADVVDYWLDQTGAHIDDIERQLAAAAEFISHAQIVIGQRKRAA